MPQVGSPFQKPPIPSPAPTPTSAPIAASAPPPSSGSSFVMWALIAVLGIGGFAVFWFGLSRQQTPRSANPAVASTSGPVAAPQPAPAKLKLSAEERRAAADAVTALRALKSATSVGVTYADYMHRLADAKIVVDRSSALVKNTSLQPQIEGVMLSYELVGSAWNAKIQNSDLEGYLRIARDCAAAQEVLSRAVGEKYPHITYEVYTVSTLMGCASEGLTALGATVDELSR